MSLARLVQRQLTHCAGTRTTWWSRALLCRDVSPTWPIIHMATKWDEPL